MKSITVMMNEILRERVSATPMYDGKVVKSVDMSEDELNIRFEDDTGITITDEGQSCCEHRYMTTDDDVQSLVGSVIQTIMVKSGPDFEDDYDVHEQEFLEIQTNKGFITIVNHNEHNGYYGGFSLNIKEIE